MRQPPNSTLFPTPPLFRSPPPVEGGRGCPPTNPTPRACAGRGSVESTPHPLQQQRRSTAVRGAVLHAPGDVRVEDRPDPRIEQPTDAVIRLAAACVCGSDLWPYRGIEAVNGPSPMGHEYVGVVEEVGGDVRTVQPGQFVVGSFFASDNTCEICRAGYQTHCVNGQPGAPTGAQAEYARIPLADGTLVATPGMPDDDLVPGLLAASDVLGTGWLAAEIGRAHV